jgi:hypothetical protein
MKVLDLQCGNGHPFEGWFASEDDYQSQSQRSMVQCPLCGDHGVVKKLSAPRLSLTGAQAPSSENPVAVARPASHEQALVKAWMEVARHVIANTTDVGNRFAEEARKMHYGEAEERSIRGKTTADEARALQDEGIEVMPILMPRALNEPLQ